MKASNVVPFPGPPFSSATISTGVLEAAWALGSVAEKIERAPLSLECKAVVLAELIAIGTRLKSVMETIRDDTSKD